jgi:hypothetical protein
MHKSWNVPPRRCNYHPAADSDSITATTTTTTTTIIITKVAS